MTLPHDTKRLRTFRSQRDISLDNFSKLFYFFMLSDYVLST